MGHWPCTQLELKNIVSLSVCRSFELEFHFLGGKLAPLITQQVVSVASGMGFLLMKQLKSKSKP